MEFAMTTLKGPIDQFWNMTIGLGLGLSLVEHGQPNAKWESRISEQ